MIYTHVMTHLSNPALEFVAAPALAPAEVQVDAALMQQYKEELEKVRQSSFHIDLSTHATIG
jgi:hypothetical protein